MAPAQTPAWHSGEQSSRQWARYRSSTDCLCCQSRQELLVCVQLMGSSAERSPEDHLSQTRHSNSHSQGSLMDQTGTPQWAEAHSGLSYSIPASEVHLPHCGP